MPTDLYKPHAINFASGTDITQLEDLSPEFSMEDILVHSASEVLPGMTGSMSAKPMLTMGTTQIKEILDRCTTDNVCAGYSASNTDLEFRVVSNLTGRVALATTSHARIRMTHFLLSWNTIEARIDSLATINFSMRPISSGGNAPMIYGAGVAITATSAVQAVFELGPVVLDGTTLCAQGVSWNNNLKYSEKRCGGGAYLEHVSVDTAAPELTIDVEDITTALALLPGGSALTSLSFYLRKKAASGINVSDATEEHILISASVGTITPVGPKKIRCRVHSFSIDTTSAIA